MLFTHHIAIGPLSGLGGASKLFDELALHGQSLPGLIVMDSGAGGSRRRKVVASAAALARVAVTRPRSVAIHASHDSLEGDASRFGRILSRAGPIVLRAFGGQTGRVAPPPIPHHVGLYLVETLAQVRAFRHAGIDKVEWFPNHRSDEFAEQPKLSIHPRRLVYVGRIAEEKGVGLLLEAAGDLPEAAGQIGIDLYGPCQDVSLLRRIEQCDNVDYKGIIQPGSATRVIAQYDALLFPSMYIGEGHPGVVIESYFAGRPVVASRWLSIPEVVTPETGVLFEPGVAEDLCRAIDDLRVNYSGLAAGAWNARLKYRSSEWTNRYWELVMELT